MHRSVCHPDGVEDTGDSGGAELRTDEPDARSLDVALRQAADRKRGDRRARRALENRVQ